MIVGSEYRAEDTSAARLAASPAGIRAFHEAGYGLSVHLGLYSLNRHGREWIYWDDRMAYEEYRQRMSRFELAHFDADEWADLMVEAGQRFLLITTKHHDGFCLWDAADTDFTVMGTPFGRDLIGELTPALRERDIGLHFYYSLIDWTHPAFRRDWPGYVAYYQGQVRELCSSFGPIGGFLFDGYWPRQTPEDDEERAYFEAGGPWDLAGTYDLIHSLQPDAVITNNSHIPPLQGEDYQVWELDLPGQDTTGFNSTELGEQPTACWWNLNHGWSYQPWQHAVKDAEDILATLRAVLAADAVFMLNVGARPFGDIHPDEQAVLRRIGQVLREGRFVPDEETSA